MAKQAQQQQAAQSDFDAAKFILDCGNKSKAIRALAAQGKERKDIAKMLGIRYQHVRNVLEMPLKRDKQAA